jgi:arginine decarboxylase-like protein
MRKLNRYGTDEKVKLNKNLFGRRIEQLKVIVEDEKYIPKENTNSYHEFIFSMYVALIGGRKITSKMELAITNIVKSYSNHLNEERDPKLRKQKLDYTENTISKLSMIKRRLDECNYTRSYTADKLYFLDSIEKQVYSRGSLSIKQRKALNGMYNQFTKRIEKNENKA